jgi:hypothetical protein
MLNRFFFQGDSRCDDLEDRPVGTGKQSASNRQAFGKQTGIPTKNRPNAGG